MATSVARAWTPSAVHTVASARLKRRSTTSRYRTAGTAISSQSASADSTNAVIATMAVNGPGHARPTLLAHAASDAEAGVSARIASITPPDTTAAARVRRLRRW